MKNNIGNLILRQFFKEKTGNIHILNIVDLGENDCETEGLDTFLEMSSTVDTMTCEKGMYHLANTVYRGT